MSLISVIIPYFQRKPGILRKALRSIMAQKIPPAWRVEVHVVDDGSPHPASEEMIEMADESRCKVLIHEQANQGVSSARNVGLDQVSAETTLIAYLDSDDIWLESHLEWGFRAYESGHDFCFSDNSRAGHHDSYFDFCPETRRWIDLEDANAKGLCPIPKEELPFLVVKEFPAHISSIIHAAELAPNVRFSETLQCSGEDVLYLTQLACAAKSPSINPHTKIQCGDGVNLFFGSLGWDSVRFLGIKRDQIIAYSLVCGLSALPGKAFDEARRQLKMNRSEFVFHLIRKWRTEKSKIPTELFDLFRFDWRTVFWLPTAFVRVLRYY